MRTLGRPYNASFSTDRKVTVCGLCAVAFLALLAQFAAAAEVTIALPTKSFQQIIFPLALERGYMKEEGIDLKVTFMEPTPSIQALVADSIQLTASGGSGSYTFAVTVGSLPTGLSLASGAISGTPTATGVFNFTITATDTLNSCTGSQAFSISIAPVAVGDSYPAASHLVDNTQFVITGGSTTSPATPFVGSLTNLIANDLPSGGVTATPGTFTTSGLGSVTIAADGTFIYTPKANPAAAAVTSDSFTYTVVSNGVTSAAATVNLTLANRVWYVKNNGAAGNGQSQNPFNTLAAAQAASLAGDIIFVYNGDATTTGQNAGITLKANQQLIGEGVALVVNTVTLKTAGTKPQITNTAPTSDVVTLHDGNTVAGLVINNATRDGIAGNAHAGFTGDTLNIFVNAAAGLHLQGFVVVRGRHVPRAVVPRL